MVRTLGIWKLFFDPFLSTSKVSRRLFTYRITTGKPIFDSIPWDKNAYEGKTSLVKPLGALPSLRRPCFRSLPDLNDNPFCFKRGEVLEVEDFDTLTRIINFRPFKDTLVGILFYTEWCEPCNWFSRYWDEWAVKYPDSVFLNCDVDKDRMFYMQHKVRAVPTTILYREFIRLIKIEGAYTDRILEMVDVISADVLPVRGEPQFFKYYCSDQYYNGKDPDYY